VFNTYPTPSLEPAFQFQTRYSRLLWAPDIKLAWIPTRRFRANTFRPGARIPAAHGRRRFVSHYLESTSV
jgi:hypothetical protein